MAEATPGPAGAVDTVAAGADASAAAAAVLLPASAEPEGAPDPELTLELDPVRATHPAPCLDHT